MALASAPFTRLSATDVAPGCTNCTDSPAAILKLRQSSTAFCVPWFSTSDCAVGFWAVTWPAPTVSPAGRAMTSEEKGATSSASSRETRRCGLMR